MEFVVLASAHFVALLSPGPDFLLILHGAARLERRYGFALCAGIATANLIYICSALLGFEVFRQVDWLMALVKVLGSVYLIYIGSVLLRAGKRNMTSEAPKHFIAVPRITNQFGIGFMSGILNPKNAVFYLSLFTLMVSEHTPLPIKCFYGLWMFVIVLVWDCLIVLVINNAGFKNWLGNALFYVEKVAGSMLACFGVVLLLA